MNKPKSVKIATNKRNCHDRVHFHSSAQIYSLGSGRLFFLISLAHITGIKLPLFFVYFDVPFTVYQDRIISFFAFGWAVFIATLARNPKANLKFVRALIISAIGALAVLSYINLTTDFAGYSSSITD